MVDGILDHAARPPNGLFQKLNSKKSRQNLMSHSQKGVRVSASSHNTLCLPACTSSAGMGDGPVKVIRQAGARHPDVKVTFSLVDRDENGVKNSFTDLTNMMVS